MPSRSRIFTVLREIVPVLAVILAVLTVIGLAQPAAAQFFPFFDGGGAQRQRGGFGGGLFGGGNDAPYFAPFQEAPRRAVREDYSRAPAPEKRANATQQPERNIVVLGDAMADWLGYGLEDAYSEQADIGIVRRHRTVSGLTRYQTKGDPADWPAAAKGVLAPESPAVIVIMLGLNDRVALRETARTDKKPAEPAKPASKPADGRDTDLPDDAAAADNTETPSIIAPEKNARATSGTYEFREDRWVELYTRKIEDMIAAAKTKGVPVVWVGLPAVRGTKATSDMLFLNALYRDVAQKAGITYVDVWDGFVDEAGRYMQQGPDFEGQTRRLRSYDGVYFTKAGARKLAHYAEREINRLLATRSAPLELPTEPEKQPEVEAKPGGPPPRPLWGPIVPLAVASVASDQLMGGPSAKVPSGETQLARALIKGEALTPAPGRADDGVWPRREVGREAAPKGGEMPEMASSSSSSSELTTSVAVAPSAAPPPDAQKKRRPPIQPQQASPAAAGGFDLFGGFGGFSSPPQQAQVPQRPQQRQVYQQPYQQPYQQQQQVRAPGLFTGGSPFGGLFR